MVDRRVHLPLYAVLVLILGSVLTPIVSIYASVQIAERQRVAARVERCDEYAGLIGILEPVGAQLTGAGRGLLTYYKSQYAEIGCKPTK